MIDEDVLLTRELLKLLMRRISVMKQIKHSISNINSFTLSQKIPDAQLIVYPDAEHGSLFQFPELFVTHGRIFLDGPLPAPRPRELPDVSNLGELDRLFSQIKQEKGSRNLPTSA